jgi:hypothetical protein
VEELVVISCQPPDGGFGSKTSVSLEGDMKKQFLSKLGIAAALAASAFSVTVTNASAQNLDIYVGPGYHRPPPPDYGRPPPGYGGGYGRRGCDPRQAEDIARDYGLRRARVSDVTPRRVIVDGFSRRGPDTMVFANVRGCPVMGR